MKTYRIYFNYRSTAPVVWAIDEGTQQSEIHVQRVEVDHGVSLRSCFTAERQEGAPCAWFEVTASCRIEGGVARFYAENVSEAEEASFASTARPLLHSIAA